MGNGRLPGESMLAVTFFKTYRPADDGRSLESRGNQKVTGKKRSVSLIEKWSVQYRWVEHVAAFDGAECRLG